MVKFPATAFRDDAGEAVNHEPIHVIDKVQQTFRLSITPWDLQRIIQAANEVGLTGKQVKGFGYDYTSENIYIAPTGKRS
jgi:hypothetical protein